MVRYFFGKTHLLQVLWLKEMSWDIHNGNKFIGWIFPELLNADISFFHSSLCYSRSPAWKQNSAGTQRTGFCSCVYGSERATSLAETRLQCNMWHTTEPPSRTKRIWRMETTSSTAAARMRRGTYLTISPQKLFFFLLRAQGPLMPYLDAIKLLKAFLTILWDDISSACSISKRRKVTGLEWGGKNNKIKPNELVFLVVRSNVILHLSSYLNCSMKRCNYKQSVSPKQTKFVHCRKRVSQLWSQDVGLTGEGIITLLDPIAPSIIFAVTQWKLASITNSHLSLWYYFK